MLTQRIINGESVDIPPTWMGRIFRSKIVKCGCTLVNKNWILTAAHCVYKNLKPNNYRIRLGDESGSKHHITNIFIHPLFEDIKYSHDIALLRLSKSTDISSVQLGVINTSTSSTISTIGWGFIDVQHDSPNKLQMATNLKLLPFIICANLYGLVDTGLQLCINQTMSGAYTGDSGGPLLINDDIQIGIVSFDARDDFTLPGVYTKVSPYQNWMHQLMITVSSPPPPSQNNNMVLIISVGLGIVILVSMLLITLCVIKKLHRQKLLSNIQN